MAQEEQVTLKRLNKEHIRAYMVNIHLLPKPDCQGAGIKFPTVGRPD